MSSILVCCQRGDWFVVGFECDRLTDPAALEITGRQLAAHLRGLPLRCQVVISFEGVERTSSALIGLLNSAKAIVADRLGRLVLCRAGTHVREMLRLTKLDRQFEIRERLRDVVGMPTPATALLSVGARDSASNETEWID